MTENAQTAAQFAAALQHFQAGRLREAEQQLRAVLARNTSNPDALHLLGLAVAAQGRHTEAIDLIGRVAAVYPNVAEIHYNLGRAQRGGGKLKDAIASYRRAVALKPGFADAFCNLGDALREDGAIDDAVAACRQALALKPDFAEALNNLGNALNETGAQAEAFASYRKAVALQPNFAEAHSNIAALHHGLGETGAALSSCRQALALNPNLAEAHRNMGNILRDSGKLHAAVESYHRALSIRPDMVSAHYNLGLAQRQMDDWPAAKASLSRAVALEPDNEKALGALVRVRQMLCDWDGLEADIARLRQCAERGKVVSPFVFISLSDSPAEHLANAKRFAARIAEGRPFIHRPPSRDRKIRLGYLSADFHEHATAYLTAELFERHDRGRFEVRGYSFGPDDGSAIRRRLTQGFDQFIDLQPLSHRAAAERIQGDGVDILIDVKGHTQHSRPAILAHRPAPIQVNWLAYPGTMGADFIDYVVVDPIVVPPEQQIFYTEQRVQLPECYQSNDSRRQIAAATPARRDAGLPENAFVFCCFNNPWKITPHIFGLWTAILSAVPGSVLWLLGDDTIAANLRREAAARGIDPARLVFAGRMLPADHLARHRLADLFLDTLPYNAHTTASDALWAGLPVLTMMGESFAGRVAASLLHAIGLPELIAGSEDAYRTLAIDLATHPDRLAQIKRRLADNRLATPLFDCGRFTHHLEAAYQTMWQRWRDGQPPAPITVPAARDHGPMNNS